MFTVCNYTERELTVQIIALFIVSFVKAKSSKKLVKNEIFILKYV